MLDLAQIQAVRAHAKKSSTGLRKFAWVRGEDGQLVKVALATVAAAELGSFQGRAGSLRRSRKGATRRLANGRRNYIAPWNGRVVSYKP